MLEFLLDPALRVRCAAFPGCLSGLDSAGLYAWWVDSAGAEDLTAGLGHAVGEGLVYAGQAGAGMSSRSLAHRIRQHRRGNIRGSTFRWTLAAALQKSLNIDPVARRRIGSDGERRLSAWIDEHLSVAVYPLADRGSLLVAEAQVLAHLNPPFNLDGMVATPLRERLSDLRYELGRAKLLQVSPEADVARRRDPETTGVAPPSGRIDALALLAGLVGKTIPTITGKPNRILALDEEFVTVATGKSPDGKAVPITWVQTALDCLIRDRTVEVNVETVGYRSAFIGAVLATVSGAKIDVRPRRVYL